MGGFAVSCRPAPYQGAPPCPARWGEEPERERAEFSPQAETAQSGLCGDEAQYPGMKESCNLREADQKETEPRPLAAALFLIQNGIIFIKFTIRIAFWWNAGGKQRIFVWCGRTPEEASPANTASGTFHRDEAGRTAADPDCGWTSKCCGCRHIGAQRRPEVASRQGRTGDGEWFEPSGTTAQWSARRRPSR